jgi:hypothetical protein
MVVHLQLGPSHSRGMSRWIDSQSIFRVKLDPVLFKIEILLTTIRVVNRAQRDWQAQIRHTCRDGLATRLTLHTVVPSHDGYFGDQLNAAWIPSPARPASDQIRVITITAISPSVLKNRS